MFHSDRRPPGPIAVQSTHKKNLKWGSEVFFKVVIYHQDGTMKDSPVYGGSRLITYPDQA